MTEIGRAVRVRFARGDNTRFISHLDLIKLFERTIRRSGLPVAYSKGFNPHPQMVFALPLPVGVTSEGEYADFELAAGISPEQFRDTMNSSLPSGVEILEAWEKKGKTNLMSMVSAALFEITVFFDTKAIEGMETVSFDTENIEGMETVDYRPLPGSKPVKSTRPDFHENIKAGLDKFLALDVVIMKKEGKAGIKDVNIRPMIHKLEIYENNKLIPAGYEDFAGSCVIEALLDAGSISNLKPDLLLSAINEKGTLKIASARIHRKQLFARAGGALVLLSDEGLL